MAFLTIALLPLAAQVTGRLSGTVLDPDGKPVANAKISLYLADSTVEDSSTLSDRSGNFLFPSLRPTYYDMVIEAANFKKSSQKGVKIDPLTETPLAAMKLELGETRESVEAQAAPQQLQTSSGQVSAVLSQEQVNRLPLAQRDPLALLDILPGVSSNGRAAARIINGQSTSFSNITFDGINIQNSFLRGNALGFTSNRLRTDQLSEATIVTANPSATFSGGSTQIAFNPPSGSNQFHATAVWTHINSALAAQRFVDNQFGTASKINVNQIGATLSGPLVKNKLFFLANYEGFLDRSTFTRRGNVPVIVPTSDDPVFQSALNLFAAPNAFVRVGNSSFNFSQEQNNHGAVNGGLLRLDYLRSAQNTFSLTYTGTVGKFDDPASSSIYQRTPTTFQELVTNFYSGTWRYASKAGKFINELRAGGNLPSIDFRNRLRDQYKFIAFLTNRFQNPMLGVDPQGRDDYLYNYQDTASFNVGRHSLQAGFSLQQYRLTAYGINRGPLDSLSVPMYSACEIFDAGCAAATKAGLVFQVDQAYGILSSSSNYIRGVAPASRPAQSLTSGFLQDSWRVRPGLTLNLGLRFDQFSPVRERARNAILPVIPNGAFTNLYNPNLRFAFAGDTTGGHLNQATDNWSPNIGFAWTPVPSKPLVVRGAYNTSYVNDDLLRHMSGFALEDGFQGFTATLSIPNGTPLINRPSTGTVNLPQTLNLAALRTLSRAAVNAVNPGLKTPYVHQWNFAVETNLLKTIFSARYVGNHLVNGLRSIDVDPDGVNSAARSAIWLLSNLGHSTYHALQLQGVRRTRAGLAFDVNYTFSKALSNLDDYSQGQRDPHISIRNPGLNRAPASFDLRHAFKSTWVYDIPMAKGGPAVLEAFRNWSVSGIVLAQSGAPLSILSGSRTSDDADIGAITTLTAGQIEPLLGIKKDGNGVSYLNAPSGTFSQALLPDLSGILQRRMFTGPGAVTTNVGLRRLFPIKEGKSIEFRTEAFNLVNRVNWFAFDARLSRGLNFGRDLRQDNNPRRIQFMLRANF
jgi:hypothetical protein